MNARGWNCLGLACWLLLAPAPAVLAQVTASFVGATPDTADGTTYTLTDVSLGAEAADRDIIIGVGARKAGTTNCSISSATVGGVTAASVVTASNNPTNCNLASLRLARVPTGTTATIVVTFPATFALVDVKVFRATNLRSATAYDTGSSTASDPTDTLNVRAHGLAIGLAVTRAATPTTVTWAGLTESDDTIVDNALTSSAAMLTPATLQTGLTVTADFASGPVESVGVWASWAPIGPVAVTPTHFVTSNGNASTGECTVGDPCTLTRAFALAGGDLMPPGSYVSIAAGVYGQAAISTTGGGVSGFPIRFVGAGVGETRITGTRTHLTASGWSLTSGRTYEHAFDESALYTVSQVCQRPGATWTPIVVDDRVPPFTTSSFRVYDLDEPVCYTPETSIADVEATHCTFFHNTTTNLLYIHPCMETQPADADLIYAGSSGWGRITYTGNGDFLTLEQGTMEHTGQGDGLKVETSSQGGTLRNFKFLGARAWVTGFNWTGEDLLLKQFAQQGPDNSNCYSPVYGSRSCWNENGDGYLLLIGTQGGSASGNVFRRITLERGWNGYRLDGNNTLEYASAWGFANHIGQISGTGGVIRDSIFLNGQDAGPYVEGESFNNLTIERNIMFPAGPWLWASRDGATQGGVTPPSAVTVRYNVLGNVLYDTLVAPALTSDCNVYVPRSVGQSSLMRITEVDNGGGDVSVTTLAAWQAATAFDDNSTSHASTAWTNGSIFATFAGQQPYAANFTTALTLADAAPITVCGVRAGPANLALVGSSITRRFRFRLPTP
jgi:hypothetical protein